MDFHIYLVILKSSLLSKRNSSFGSPSFGSSFGNIRKRRHNQWLIIFGSVVFWLWLEFPNKSLQCCQYLCKKLSDLVMCCSITFIARGRTNDNMKIANNSCYNSTKHTSEWANKWLIFMTICIWRLI